MYPNTLCFLELSCNLWSCTGKKSDSQETYKSIIPSAMFDQWMKLYHFKHFHSFVTSIWEDESMMTTDPWWQFQPAIDEFNEIRKDRFVFSVWSIADECMSAWRPRTTALGQLPNISYIARKPENLGKFFLFVDCCFITLSTNHFV